MTTPELVASLNPGDTVAVSRLAWPEHPVTGVVHDADGGLYAGPTLLRHSDGSPHSFTAYIRIEVLERAAPPLYVNHPRAVPVDGDVVRDADRPEATETWQYDGTCKGPWSRAGELSTVFRPSLPGRLRLLVDGDTGQVVQ